MVFGLGLGQKNKKLISAEKLTKGGKTNKKKIESLCSSYRLIVENF